MNPTITAGSIPITRRAMRNATIPHPMEIAKSPKPTNAKAAPRFAAPVMAMKAIGTTIRPMPVARQPTGRQFSAVPEPVPGGPATVHLNSRSGAPSLG
jgi:hypothetical protein